MAHDIARAAERLFGPDGLQAAHVGIAVGSDRDATPSAVAGQILRVLDQLERGDFEIVDEFDD